MDISSRAEFPAPVEEVFTMMLDRTYLERVCQASGAIRYEATSEGLSTRTSRTLPAPEAAARFTGPELTVVEEVGWTDPGADGVRRGTVKLAVPGQPVTMNGEVRLTPGASGTVAELTGELKVAIPLLGKKLEQSAAPAVLAGFRTQQQVGNDWLRRH